ncbi:MAG: 30S ribosomal protein S9 [Patescibacteria group bacterium]
MEKGKKYKYFESVGRRKTASARVRIFNEGPVGNGVLIVNGKPYENYFQTIRCQVSAFAPLKALGGELKSIKKAEVKVTGGGVKGQAEAVRLGLARAIVKWLPDLKKEMRVMGYLTRDARAVERKKYGLRKARRGQQWRKR